MKSTPSPAAEQAPALLSVRALAHMLDVSTRGVWRLLDAGRMPQPLKIGRSVRWRREAIQEWIDAGCPSCRPAPSGPLPRGGAR